MTSECGKSQANKRLAAARRLGVHVSRRAPQPPPPTISVENQVGLLASMGLSDSKFQKLRLDFRGAVFGMASLHALRKSRATLSREPCAAVSEDDTGAHLVNLRAALERRLVDLCQSKLSVERLVCDEQG